ncbi:hypothetical protein GQ457_06G014930 [Hibiscus cannabinus]
MVQIFYYNARCTLNEAKIETIAIESYLIGKSYLLGVQIIANHLGLENEGLDDETVILPNLHHPDTFAFVLDVHDHFIHLMISWFFNLPGENGQ